MIKSFKNICFLFFFSLCLWGCGMDVQYKTHWMVHKCLYNEFEMTLEKEEKPYSQNTMSSMADDAIVQCEKEIDEFIKYSFYETLKAEESRKFSKDVDIFSYYLTRRFVFGMRDSIYNSLKDMTHKHFKDHVIEFYMNENEKY